VFIVRLCSESDIVDNSVRRFVIEGERDSSRKAWGKYHALDERCTHRGGPVSEGSLEDGVITCPWHYGQFDLATGEVRGPPPVEPLKSYELRVEGSDILISIV
jgi:CDP-4-dehydro-6-deoxyglucose reductase/3-phenylpropionate/trans-cinnamate dioxygenase ferredoxin subunit/anthranilate 1,2-dioxygenase ferredoxin subunit